MPMHLFHITSIENAIAIVRTKHFRPEYPDPLASDSGLNAGIVGRQLPPQQLGGQGATLFLDFDGPLVPMGSFPLAIGFVYDALPWRVMVPNGTVNGLTIVGFQFMPGTDWKDAIPNAPWWKLTKESKLRWQQNRAAALSKEILNIIATQPVLRVG
jgi:hypothetical protein